MIIRVENNYSYIEEGNLNLIDNCCTLIKDYVYQQIFLMKHSYKPKYHIDSFSGEFNAAKKKARERGYNYMIPIPYTKKYKNNNKMFRSPVFKQKDIKFMDMRKRRFPTGWLFQKVIPTLKKHNVNYQLIDNRNIPKYTPLNKKLPYNLRYYQQNAVDKAKESHRFIVNLATGGGKTLVAMGIINAIGLQSLFVVPSLSILNQTYKRFQEVFGEELVDIIGDNQFSIKHITVATVQSLWQKKNTKEVKNLMNNIQIMILDECHHINVSGRKSTNTWYQLAMQSNAPIRIGLTATPGKDKDINFQMLKAATGKIGIQKTLKDLIEEEFLVPATIYMPNIKVKSYKHWKTAIKESIHLNDKRNKKIAKLAKQYKRQNKKVLITVNRIKTQANELIELLPNALCAFGETSTSDRKEVFNEFRDSDKGKILISSVVGEGWDAPEAEILIIAQGGKGGSRGRGLLQKIGRVLRKSKYKDRAIIIDFFDKDSSTLQKHSRERYRTYKRPNAFTIKREYPKIKEE